MKRGQEVSVPWINIILTFCFLILVEMDVHQIVMVKISKKPRGGCGHPFVYWYKPIRTELLQSDSLDWAYLLIFNKGHLTPTIIVAEAETRWPGEPVNVPTKILHKFKLAPWQFKIIKVDFGKTIGIYKGFARWQNEIIAYDVRSKIRKNQKFFIKKGNEFTMITKWVQYYRPNHDISVRCKIENFIKNVSDTMKIKFYFQGIKRVELSNCDINAPEVVSRHHFKFKPCESGEYSFPDTLISYIYILPGSGIQGRDITLKIWPLSQEKKPWIWFLLNSFKVYVFPVKKYKMNLLEKIGSYTIAYIGGNYAYMEIIIVVLFFITLFLWIRFFRRRREIFTKGDKA